MLALGRVIGWFIHNSPERTIARISHPAKRTTTCKKVQSYQHHGQIKSFQHGSHVDSLELLSLEERNTPPPTQTFKLKGLGHLLPPSHKYSPPIRDPRHSVPHNSPIYSLKLLVLEGGVARVTPGEPPRPTECHAKKVVPGSVYLNKRQHTQEKRLGVKGGGGWCQI